MNTVKIRRNPFTSEEAVLTDRGWRVLTLLLSDVDVAAWIETERNVPGKPELQAGDVLERDGDLYVVLKEDTFTLVHRVRDGYTYTRDYFASDPYTLLGNVQELRVKKA